MITHLALHPLNSLGEQRYPKKYAELQGFGRSWMRLDGEELWETFVKKMASELDIKVKQEFYKMKEGRREGILNGELNRREGEKVSGL